MIRHLHLTVFCMVVVLFCCGYILLKAVQPQNTTQTLKNMAAQEQHPKLPEIFSCEPIDVITKSTYTSEYILKEYKNIYVKNNDLSGWITIGDAMSLPVMYTPTDPEFYLTHGIDRSAKKYGTPFMDARCEFNPMSDNIIIHGHNMNDKTAFSPLMNYKKTDFFNDHKLIKFDTLYEKNEYEVYAVFVSTFDDDSSKNSYYNTVNFKDKDTFNSFITEIAELSLYESEITPQYGDSFITLMTCTNRHDSERMNVIGIKKN